MPTLVIDIETIGEDFDSLDEITQSELTKNIEHSEGTPEYEQELEQVKRNMVFSPLTGQIVAIGVLDADKDQAVVYYQAPGQADAVEVIEDNVVYKPMTEKQMLESFWGGAARYTEFITWNGRGFDIPYLNTRSMVHEVSITKDLMSHRFTGSQRFDARHIDLYDQISYYGAVRRPGSLHMWCRALGIQTPKSGDIAASAVGQAFKEEKYLDIARYNAKDIIATKELYQYWKKYLAL